MIYTKLTINANINSSNNINNSNNNGNDSANNRNRKILYFNNYIGRLF